jgi:hypothetical protein
VVEFARFPDGARVIDYLILLAIWRTRDTLTQSRR